MEFLIMDAEKAMRGIRTYCNREGFGVGHTFTFTVTGNIHQTLIHLRNFKVFVSSMMTLNIFIMSYLEVLKKSDSGN